MYVNKCIKCGVEFETKNPKRVICPNCLYADKSAATEETQSGEKKLTSYSSYSTEDRGGERPQRSYNNQGYNRNNNNRGGYNNNRRYDNNYGDNRDRGGYQQRRPYNNGGGYNNQQNRGGYNSQGGYQQQGGGYNRDGGNRFGGGQRRPNNNRFQQGGNRRPGGRPQPRKQAKPLLISKEQLEQIEVLYKTMLPLPNPDAHETIGTHLGIEPRKVFFGINLVRQKLMLPKLPFPKRKLAVTVDQMTAIKSLYTPLLPLPPIGCHKIIAAQLKVDEWRVHVAIKLIRAQMGLDRWNEDRPDKPADYMVPKYPAQEKAQEESAKVEEVVKEEVVEPTVEEAVEEAPKKRGRKPKAEKEEAAEAPVEESVEEAPKKRGRKPKKAEDE